jgi:membrane protease YdiL (CAAX protease family)
VAWLALVALLIALGYGSRIASGKPDPEVLYRWSTAIGGLIQDGIVLGVVLAIAGGTSLLALRRPKSLPQAAAIVGIAIVAIYAFEAIYSAIVHPGNEQGLTPTQWEPGHAAAYIANAVVICTWVPFVEELTYRGLGFAAVRDAYGATAAIVVTALAFGLAHGLFAALPVLSIFGAILAWLRFKTDSLYPSVILHGVFNGAALIAAVST